MATFKDIIKVLALAAAVGLFVGAFAYALDQIHPYSMEQKAAEEKLSTTGNH